MASLLRRMQVMVHYTQVRCKCKCSCFLSEFRNKSSKFYKISSILTKTSSLIAERPRGRVIDYFAKSLTVTEGHSK